MRKKFGLIFLIMIIVNLACGGIPQGESEPPASEEIDAKDAIQTYAYDVLGLDIPNMFAGGTTGQLSLPVSVLDGIELAIDLAGTTYFGVWSGGIASLSFGDSDVSGDLVADVKDGALGVFGLTVSSPYPEDPGTAQTLIKETYPGLAGYQWIEIPSERGYAFTAGETDNVSVQSWSIELTGTTINAGVTPSLLESQSFVWVVVASGVLAAPFQQ